DRVRHRYRVRALVRLPAARLRPGNVGCFASNRRHRRRAKRVHLGPLFMRARQPVAGRGHRGGGADVAMSRINLNDSRVNALKPRAKRYFVIDSITPGLLVQVMPSGVKSWMVRARYPNGNNRVRRRLALVGTVTVEQARTEARRWLGLLSQGLDPQRELSERKRQALAEN